MRRGAGGRQPGGEKKGDGLDVKFGEPLSLRVGERERDRGPCEHMAEIGSGSREEQ